MRVLVDKGQKKKKHDLKHSHMERLGAELIEVPLPAGDYIAENEKVADVIRRKNARKIPIKKMDLLGTYDVSVDTKRDIQEAIGNICGKQHDRFRDELILAQNNGIRLYVLVENEDSVSCLFDLYRWENPRARVQKWITTPSGERRKIPVSKNPTTGETLAKAMKTMEAKYGVTFCFCHPDETGKKILELLEETR